LAMNFSVLGADTVADRIRLGQVSILDTVRGELKAFGEDLSRTIRDDKLSGSPLQERTGALKNSVVPVFEDEGEIISGGSSGGAGIPYARPLEYGSRPHIIEAVRARFLRFEWHGDIVFFRYVHHPGNRAYGFMDNTFKEEAPGAIGDMRNAIYEALR
ncbi:hypothetical protein B1A_15938, partial [mine drainage metagenome]